jgi:DNA-binding winged helix-turn-helix (wHTH) protein/tetratricopeptide (TPR) repeat protein
MSGSTFALGPFSLGGQCDLLLHGTEPVALGRRAIALLRALVARPRSVVSKDALIEAAWSGQEVEESNLTVQIAALRRVLGKEPGGERWIQTMPRRGYRFVGPVVVEEENDATAAPPRGEGAPDAAPTQQSEAEHRQITAMSCELVGAAAVPGGMGLEDQREAIGVFQRCVAEVVGRHHGFIARHLGNNLLVLFGYPAAHEHDAEQAVSAGLELCAAVRTHGPGAEVPMRCRVGIATGIVIIGDLVAAGERRVLEIVGGAPDLAARLQISTQPGTVAIDPATRRLIGNLFACRGLGAIETNSGTEPMHIWQVLGESVVASRFEALRGAALSPMIGRDEEIDLLLRRWARAKAGAGQIVLVSGEAGLGKSRITAELAERLHGEPHLCLRYFCSPHRQDSALFPFIDQLSRAAGFARDDTPAARWEKFEALLARAAPPDEDVAFLADLMSLPASERHPLPNLSPQLKKERTLEALVRQLEGLARSQPVVTVFEDAHWIDPTSRELLDLTIEQLRSLPVLLILTFRPEFQPPWAGQPQVTVLALNRLDRHDRTALATQIAGGKALPDEVVAQIVNRTDGVPLFIEEFTKSVLESGLLREEVDRYVLDRALPPFAIPTTLHASLLARLDRSASVRHVAQIGAAIGREFSYELLLAVSRLPEDELKAAVASLVASELVFQHGTPPEAVYSFKHALIQDAAYQSLLRRTRQQYHHQMATLLEDRFPEMASAQPELVAHHYSEAICPAQAITYWLRAGVAAASKSANLEAIAQFGRGLELADALSDPRERAERELDLQMVLGPALVASKAYSHPDVGRTYARALELCRQLGDHSRELTALRGLQLHHNNLLEMEKALHFAEEALRVAGRLDDAARLVGAHTALGSTLYQQGKLDPALAHFRRGFELFDPHMQFPDWPGSHPAVQCQHSTMLISWMLGYPDRSLEELRAAVRSAETLGHPLTLAQTLCLAAYVHIFRHEPSAAANCAERALGICEEQRIAQYHAVALCVNGWAVSASGESEKGLAQIRQGLDGYGLGTAQHVLLALQADAQLASGKPEAALASVAAGLQAVEKAGGAQLEAELHRLRGEALLAGAGTASEAETAIEKGIEVARRQNAKSWELRGAMSLARLRRQQGRQQEAVALLAPILGWFTEGFDTADLMEAKTLLDKLTEPAIAAEG